MSNDDTRTEEQKRADFEHRKRVAQLDRIEQRMRHPLAVKTLTNAIRVGLSTMIEQHDAAA